jgi:hypothetical protein
MDEPGMGDGQLKLRQGTYYLEEYSEEGCWDDNIEM